MRVSLDDIAAACGVSKMTVSRALRGLSKIRPERAAQIRATAEKMGYIRNPLATRLMSAAKLSHYKQYRETVAFIWTGRERHSSYELAGAVEQAKNFRLQIEEFHPSAEGLSGRRMSQILEARGIRGVILAPHARTNYPHYWLPWEKFSCVVLGSSLRNHGLLRVQNDHFYAGMLAMRAAKHRGYQRPGLVIGRNFHERSWRTYAAAVSAFSPHPCHGQDFIWWQSDDSASFFSWFRKFRPDVILVGNCLDAQRLQELGLRVPQEVGVVVLSITEMPSPSPFWAGIYHHGYQIGQEAMKALAWKIQNQETGKVLHPPVINIAGEWRSGTSLPPRASCLRRRKTERVRDLAR